MAAGAVAELPAGFTLDGPAGGSATLPPGFTVDAPTSKQPSKAAPTQPAPATPEPTGSTADFILGNLNKGIAGFAGMLPQAATDITNLGIAGYGAARGAVTGRPQDSPNLIDPGRVPGTPSNLTALMQRFGAVKPGAEPESTGGRYAAAALQALPSAALGARGVPAPPMQAVRAGTTAATSGMAGELAADIGGEEYRGVGALAPGARRLSKTPGAGERATAERQAQVYDKAKGFDIPVPPRDMKASSPQQTAQNIANRHLGNPEGAEITPATLKDFRAAHVADYEAPFKDPALKGGLQPNPKFQAKIQALGDEIAGGTATLPQTFKGVREATKLLGEYGYGAMPGGAKGTLPPRGPIPVDNARRAIRIMREGATANYQAGGESKVSLAKAQRGIANALEELVETNLKDPSAIERFRNARTAMAKSFDVEGALDARSNKVDGGKLAQLVNEGRPISGELADFAQVAGQFPSATRPPKGQEEMFTKKMSPMALSEPRAVAAHQAGRLWDPLTMSKPYQSAVVDPRNKVSPEVERMIRLFIANQQQQQGQIPLPPR